MSVAGARVESTDHVIDMTANSIDIAVGTAVDEADLLSTAATHHLRLKVRSMEGSARRRIALLPSGWFLIARWGYPQPWMGCGSCHWRSSLSTDHRGQGVVTCHWRSSLPRNHIPPGVGIWSITVTIPRPSQPIITTLWPGRKTRPSQLLPSFWGQYCRKRQEFRELRVLNSRNSCLFLQHYLKSWVIVAYNYDHSS